MRHPIFFFAILVIGMIGLGLLYQVDDASQAAQAAELNTQQIALQVELEQRADSAARLEERVVELEGYIGELNQLNERLQARQAQLETDSGLLVQRVIDLQVERDRYAAQAQSLVEENQRLTAQVTAGQSGVQGTGPAAQPPAQPAGTGQAAPTTRQTASATLPPVGGTPWWLLLGITGLPVLIIGALFIYFARTWAAH